MFFSFEYDFYNTKDENCARCEMLGSWIDMKTRKLTKLPEHLLMHLDKLEKTEDFKVLTKEDTRKFGVLPRKKD